jgi:hypothetical protein
MLDALSSFRPGPAIIVVAVATAGYGASLKSESVIGWTTYIAATEARIDRELKLAPAFLVLDFEPDHDDRRRQVLDGEILVDQMKTRDRDANDVDVPKAMVHHWRGTVFIPGATVDDILNGLRGHAPGEDQEDVLESRILERGPDHMRIFLKLHRKKFVTVVYNTEHEVTFRELAPGRATSSSVATRIAEVRDYGKPTEHELVPGEDRGFLWRLNAYWRYLDVPGGVIAECESVTLSRSLPAVFRFFAGPMIRSAARGSMERTLVTFRDRFATAD